MAADAAGRLSAGAVAAGDGVIVARYQVAIDTVVNEMAIYRLLPFAKVGAGELVRWMAILKHARGENP